MHCGFMDSRLRRFPPDHASVVPYGQAMENAARFSPLAHKSTSSTGRQLQSSKSGKVKTISPVLALAYSAPVAVQATVTTAVFLSNLIWAPNKSTMLYACYKSNTSVPSGAMAGQARPPPLRSLSRLILGRPRTLAKAPAPTPHPPERSTPSAPALRPLARHS